MRLYIIQRGGRDASTSVTSLTLHIPSSLLIYVTPMSPYRPCCRYKSCLYTNSTYTTSHSLVHLKHHLTQPRPILGIQLHSSLYQFSIIIFLNNKRGAPRGGQGGVQGGVLGGVQGGAQQVWKRCQRYSDLAKNCDNKATKLLNLSRSCLTIVTKMSHSLSQARAMPPPGGNASSCRTSPLTLYWKSLLLQRTKLGLLRTSKAVPALNPLPTNLRCELRRKAESEI